MTKYETYHSYLDSEEWAIKTAPIRERNNGLCECCNMRFGTEVHHRTYDRVFNELPTDLLLVCSPCHRSIHDIELCYIWASHRAFLEVLQAEAKRIKELTK